MTGISPHPVEARRARESGAPPSGSSPADCAHCDAVCCRLTVVVQPEDGIADHLTTATDRGLRVMARDEDGWCVAVDAARMCCSIYDARPEVCRRFRMGGPYCEAVREDYARRPPLRPIDVRLVGGLR